MKYLINKSSKILLYPIFWLSQWRKEIYLAIMLHLVYNWCILPWTLSTFSVLGVLGAAFLIYDHLKAKKSIFSLFELTPSYNLVEFYTASDDVNYKSQRSRGLAYAVFFLYSALILNHFFPTLFLAKWILLFEFSLNTIRFFLSFTKHGKAEFEESKINRFSEQIDADELSQLSQKTNLLADLKQNVPVVSGHWYLSSQGKSTSGYVTLSGKKQDSIYLRFFALCHEVGHLVHQSTHIKSRFRFVSFLALICCSFHPLALCLAFLLRKIMIKQISNADETSSDQYAIEKTKLIPSQSKYINAMKDFLLNDTLYFQLSKIWSLDLVQRTLLSLDGIHPNISRLEKLSKHTKSTQNISHPHKSLWDYMPFKVFRNLYILMSQILYKTCLGIMRKKTPNYLITPKPSVVFAEKAKKQLQKYHFATNEVDTIHKIKGTPQAKSGA